MPKNQIRTSDHELDSRQAEWVEEYQRGRVAREQLSSGQLRGRAAAEARRMARCGDDACVLLLESLSPLLKRIVREQLNSRLGEEWARSVRDDTESEARVVAISAVATYKPDRGTAVHQWVSREVRNHISALDFDAGGGTRPREWRKVAKVAHAISDDATLRHENLSSQALGDAVMEYFVTATSFRIAQECPSLSQQEVFRRAHERLSRQSISRAVKKELVELMTTSSGCVSLDGPSMAEAGTLGDTLSVSSSTATDVSTGEVVRAILSSLGEADVEDVLSVRGGSVPQGAARAYSTRHSISVSDARAELRSGVARLTSPHAQFASMWPGLDAQFEHSEETTGDVLDLLAAHRERLLSPET